MLFVFLDEFGHVGPFVHRQDPKHHTSPVFGLSGVILPEPSVRAFSSSFLKLKTQIFKEDMARSGAQAFKWEKKGSDIFRPKAIYRYQELKSLGFRLLIVIAAHRGNVFYYGIEKQTGMLDGRPIGLHTTALANAIRRLDTHCQEMHSNFVLILDQNSAHHDLLECAAKTMFGQQPAKRLLGPPFQVESHLNQNIQAADWISLITGRLWAYELEPEQYIDHKRMHLFYWDRLHRLAVHSAVNRRRQRKIREQTDEARRRPNEDTIMATALRKAGFDPEGVI